MAGEREDRGGPCVCTLICCAARAGVARTRSAPPWSPPTQASKALMHLAQGRLQGRVCLAALRNVVRGCCA